MKFNKSVLIYSIISISFLFSSCSLLISGKKQKIHINSQPFNAKIILNNKDMGSTPRTISVRKSLFTTNVTLKLDGYSDTTFRLKKEFDEVALLSTANIWIDVIAGTVTKYKDEFYHVDIKSRDNANKSFQHEPKTMFYIIKTDSDTVYTQPFIKLNAGYFSTTIKNVEFKSVEGSIQTIDASYVVKYKTQTKNILLSNGNRFIGDRYKDYVYTYLNVPYFQSKNKNLSTFMVELLENGKKHLVWSYIDTDAIDKDGRLVSTMSGNYYLYEEGKSLVKLDNVNSKKAILLHFKNYPELIKLLKENPEKFDIIDYFFDRRYDIQNLN